MKNTVYLTIEGRTFSLKSARDATARDMVERDRPVADAGKYVIGVAHDGTGVERMYEKKYVRPDRGKIPRLSHKKLWNIGRRYADLFAPHIVEQAREQRYQLPARKASELFSILPEVYALLEQEYEAPWDNLLAGQQDDLLTGFWNRLRERGIVERVH